MTDEKWQQLIDIAELQFQNVEKKTEPLVHTTQDGQEEQGTQDILVFENPMGRFKIVRENRPKVLEKKHHFSHRAGDTARTEYKTSDTEVSHKLHVYKDVGYDDWEEAKLESLGLSG